METVTLCPFTVGTVIWQPQSGAWTLTACVKATFKLEHGKDATLAEEQDPVGEDRYFDDDPRASLYAPSDLAPFKPRADVSVVGHAYAPAGRPVEALVAGFAIGDLSKSVGLIGDRIWVEGADGLEPSSPATFTKMPLRYERAARGMDNAAGLDLAAAPVPGALALPNLEATEDDAEGQTVGFGPVAPSWSSRRGGLDAAGLTWTVDRRGPAPAGFDFGYFNAAPRDQQVDLLRSNAKLVLSNLHPRHARLETRIPAVRPKAFLVDGKSGRANEIALRCDTIWIDADRSVVVVVWRGLTGIDARDDDGTLVVAVESKGREIRYKQIENLMREGALASLGTNDLATDERNPMGVRHDSIKPGGPAPPTLPTRTPPEAARTRASARRPSAEESTQTEVIAEMEPSAPSSPKRPAMDSFVTDTEVGGFPEWASDGPGGAPAVPEPLPSTDELSTETTTQGERHASAPAPPSDAAAASDDGEIPPWRDVSGHASADPPAPDAAPEDAAPGRPGRGKGTGP